MLLPGAAGPPAVVAPLLREVPEFGPSYLALAAGCEGDPAEPVILMELAEFLAGQLGTLHRVRPLVDRILAVVEGYLETMYDDPDGCELVAYALFDSLAPELRHALLPTIGPRSRALIEELDGLAGGGDSRGGCDRPAGAGTVGTRSG